jgi:hypothetical protein
MDLNAFLPTLVPAAMTFVVVSVAAMLALFWIKQPEAQTLVRRVWVGVSVLIVLGVAVFAIANGVGAHEPSVDRSLQQQQQNELHNRLQTGGH